MLQGILLKLKVSLSGGFNKDWCIEKPVSGTENTMLMFSNDALVISLIFKEPSGTANFVESFTRKKEHFTFSTTEETALLKEIDFA